jgi:hypothetical protein
MPAEYLKLAKILSFYILSSSFFHHLPFHGIQSENKLKPELPIVRFLVYNKPKKSQSTCSETIFEKDVAVTWGNTSRLRVLKAVTIAVSFDPLTEYIHDEQRNVLNPHCV